MVFLWGIRRNDMDVLEAGNLIIINLFLNAHKRKWIYLWENSVRNSIHFKKPTVNYFIIVIECATY